MQFVGSVLVRNEDVFLERAIRNASAFCDRIHVLDHMSDDRTPAILRSLADELGTLDVRRSTFSGDSHRPLETYAGTPTWVLVVDGDCLFDPSGLATLRESLVQGEHADVFRLRGHVLHCDEIDDENGTVSGYMAPPSRPIVQLFNFGALESWTGCHQRVHGGEPVFRPGYEWHSVRDLTESSEWDADPLRFVHTCFLRRSTSDPESGGEGRPNLNELRGYRRGILGRIRRAVRRPALDPRVEELHRQGLNWKQAKYRRGPRVTCDATPFRLGAAAE
ncbi:MAG TPA: glycosyltransferase family 2 protein [Gaiellaceae bacterium]|nr:glycosyltransferase family 2 protein [Gaiellaceae bacterium]